MEPEISHRCSVCGATIRPGAAFCPQCGKPVASTGPRDGERDPRATQIILDSAPTRVESESAPTIALDKTETEALKVAVARDKQEVATGADRVARQYASNATDNVRVRVERIRKVSSVVIDQAAYDPSLRFLLVAAGFFLLFLILLLASKLLG